MVTLTAIAAVTALTAGADARQAKPAAPVEATAPRPAGEPIMAVVSIKSQQVTFYDAEGWILRAPVSTGTSGRETPAGVFALLEKDKDHHSSLYDDASMPNMQRITWNGIALHGGPLPGYAASHGCVRMPYGFAEKLFDKTRIGMRVIISPIDATPVDFTDKALLVPNAEAIAAAPARAQTLARDATDAAKAADEAKKTAATTARATASLTAALRKLEGLKSRADAELAAATKAITAAGQAKARAEDLKQKIVARAAEAGTQLDAATADAKSKLDSAATADADAASDEPKKAAARAAREAASRKAALRKPEELKRRADAELASADKSLAAAGQAEARAEELKQKATARAAEAAKQLDTFKADAKTKLDAAAAAKDAVKTTEAKRVDTAKAASEAKLALEPVSVYISRATQKIYVRRNTHNKWPDGGEVFDATIEAPVMIRDPDKRIGTHIFTAVARTDGGLRWTAVTIDESDDAKDALERITIPKDVLDRIAPTASPRSSIIISDEPLSRETNYRTEFVAVLNNQPQGGFVTRKPSPRIDVRYASRGGRGDDGSLFQSSWGSQSAWSSQWGSQWGQPQPQPQPVDPRRGGRQYYRQAQPVQQQGWGWSW
jgi:hypothetical protein